MMYAATNLRAGWGSAPIAVVSAHLEIVHGSPPKMRARCPAHGSHGGTLAVRETQDGRVLLFCHAGCALDEILHSAGLSATDLFPDRESQRERCDARRRCKESPRRTVREALAHELAALRERLRAEIGYDRPLRSSDINAVRALVCRMLGRDPSTLPPVAPFRWECPPHDDDPAWPTLFVRAIEDETRRRWHALHPDAKACETDPIGSTLGDRIRAEQLAREWLRGMAS